MVNGHLNLSGTPDPGLQGSYNQVYILSLPSFVWFKANDTTGPPKYGHTCENIGNGQMVSIGGHNPVDNIDVSPNQTDPFPQGLGLFDMVDLKWVTSYNATKGPYQAPRAVKEYYASL